MAKNIRGNGDGPNGENQTYTIPGRGVVSRRELTREIEQGKHPDFHNYERDGVDYARANPDGAKSNNIDKK
ncbi:DUF3892 domain-containing protein [Aeromonas sp. MR16]|jgi:hypothetical protein|uniref:DUF3892 domain-containing protein n=1 Tax=Aeromonas sp. MR16 TaxID=2923420 RepID=UPI001F4B07F1|nr:DUF3892 domain-containing protein [Aeromonas sp. MR16]MCH7373248.1 DUF3892 domain-containing protein [Aeromonas sp. MR16]